MRFLKATFRRKWAWLVLAIVLAALIKTLFFPAPLARAHRTWKNEDGVVAFRPMSNAERLFLGIISLGLSETSSATVGRQMPEADLRSFRSLSESYGVDKNAVWYRGERVEGAEPQAFRIFPSDHHGADDTQVFYGKDVLIGADPERFRTAGEQFGYDDARIWLGAQYYMNAPRAGGALEVIVPRGNIIRFDDAFYYKRELMERAPVGSYQSLCSDWFLAGDDLFRGPLHVASGRAENAYLLCSEVTVAGGQSGVREIRGGVVFAEGREIVEYSHDKSRRGLLAFDAAIARAVSLYGENGIFAYNTLLLQFENGAVEAVAFVGDEIWRQELGSGPPLDFEQVFAVYGQAEVFGTSYEAVRAVERGDGALLREAAGPPPD